MNNINLKIEIRENGEVFLDYNTYIIEKILAIRKNNINKKLLLKRKNFN